MQIESSGEELGEEWDMAFQGLFYELSILPKHARAARSSLLIACPACLNSLAGHMIRLMGIFYFMAIQLPGIPVARVNR